MKLLSLEFITKQVVYFGLVFYVPQNIKWLATDPHGNVLGYYAKPHLCFSAFSGKPYCWEEHYQANDLIAKVNLEGLDWKDSLVEFV